MKRILLVSDEKTPQDMGRIAESVKYGLADGVEVKRGMKSGDIDPRGEVSYCDTVSDKANAVAGGVLEAILHLSGVLSEKENGGKM